MKERFAIALLTKDSETILGVFDTVEEADAFGSSHRMPHSMGLQYCYSSMFVGNAPVEGEDLSIYRFYNV